MVRVGRYRKQRPVFAARRTKAPADARKEKTFVSIEDYNELKRRLKPNLPKSVSLQVVGSVDERGWSVKDLDIRADIDIEDKTAYIKLFDAMDLAGLTYNGSGDPEDEHDVGAGYTRCTDYWAWERDGRVILIEMFLRAADPDIHCIPEELTHD